MRAPLDKDAANALGRWLVAVVAIIGVVVLVVTGHEIFIAKVLAVLVIAACVVFLMGML